MGSWMRQRFSWVDKIVISSSRGDIDGDDAHFVASKNVTTQLDEHQDYGLSVALQIANNIRGRFYVHAVTNADKTLSEVPGVSNNIGVSKEILSVPPPPAAKLILTIISSLPSQITLGIPFSIAFRVKNVGYVTTKKTSWTDALYAYGRKGANRTEVMEKGTQLKAFPRIGALAAQAFYEPNVTQPNVTQPTVMPTASTGIIITEGLLPDLQGSLGSTKAQTRGGQPLNVTFNVTNKGEFCCTGGVVQRFVPQPRLAHRSI
ncbi:hypothetical protein OS493_010260 [Desmophyllum pertusum]|uniref:Uncharacterized protein n=1 Tax=Desmophyllum pertusum TaxID=174260 RepID=A0A9X0DC41_9CNID|nr:hypothetical protein OS493_010260 [Desmophyllum pertusum]